MRKLFFDILHKKMSQDEKIVVLTADLGYGLLDNIRKDYSDRFYNTASSEQLMIGMAVGYALENKIPICYSISPFVLYRPFEFVRNYLNHEKIPVKLVGGGRNRDYGYLGFSHWADDDLKIYSAFENIKLYKPDDELKLIDIYSEFIYNTQPAYLNLKK
jgi:transketolase